MYRRLGLPLGRGSRFPGAYRGLGLSSDTPLRVRHLQVSLVVPAWSEVTGRVTRIVPECNQKFSNVSCAYTTMPSYLFPAKRALLLWILVCFLSIQCSSAFLGGVLDSIFASIFSLLIRMNDLRYDLGLVIPTSTLLLPSIECPLRFALWGQFNASNFPLYTTRYFQDDSVMTLAEAGVYEGATGVEE